MQYKGLSVENFVKFDKLSILFSKIFPLYTL